MLFLPVLAALVSCDVSGQSFYVRQVLRHTTTFLDCLFERCQSRDDGGALYLSEQSARLTFVRCIFTNCQSSRAGGGFAALDSRSVSMQETSGTNCSARSSSFCLITSSYATEVVESSAEINYQIPSSKCDGVCGPISVSSGFARVSPTYITALNSTLNRFDRVSGFAVSDGYRLWLQFSTFSGNGNRTCLLFDRVMEHEISCLFVVNHSCSGDALLVSGPPIVLSRCAFAGNQFDGFVARPTITFVGCAFDFQPFASTIECTVGAVAPEFCAEAPRATWTTVMTLEAPTETAGLRGSAIAGIVIGVCAGVSLIVVGALAWKRECPGADATALWDSLKQQQ